MSFIELKEQCNRFGITCSGLRNDYIKKLVTYELLQQVLLIDSCNLGYYSITSYISSSTCKSIIFSK